MTLGQSGIRQRQSRDFLRRHRTAAPWFLTEDSKGIFWGEASVGARMMSLGQTSTSTHPTSTQARDRQRITFDGTQNLAYQNLYQAVLVVPGTHYHFRGYLRTDQISTESGMRFEIFDPKDMKNLDILTPNETGTTPWTLEEADFTAGPKTHLIRIRLTRVPSTAPR